MKDFFSIFVFVTTMACSGMAQSIGNNDLVCHVKVADIQYNDRAGRKVYRCIPEQPEAIGGLTYAMELPEMSRFEAELEDGTMYATIPNGTVTRQGKKDRVKVPQGASVRLSKKKPKTKANKVRRSRNPRRLAQRKTGTSTVLVLHVTANDAATTLSPADLSNRIFGTKDDKVNLVSVYEGCSSSKLKFIPATGGNIVNGVGTVSINAVVKGMDSFDVDNLIVAAATAKYGNLEAKYDHVMMCLPSGTGSWVAYAYVNWYRSSYNNDWCGSPSAQAHEIGHNLGLKHSNEGGTPYDDQSGLMGYSYNDNEGPNMCFNGQKHWMLGWFSDRTITVSPSTDGSWTGRLATFVDYKSTVPGEYVIIQVEDLFIQYNRKKGINSGTKEKADEVTVTQASSLTTESESLAGLKFGESFTQNGVTIEVCGMYTTETPNFVHLSIYVALSQSSRCGEPVPTRGPTSAPSKAPTRAPTTKPTASPTMSPTADPTKTPTGSPTSSPTEKPTKAPTETPTEKPTKAPTVTPTVAPTRGPTMKPTLAPTKPPTNSPTVSPTKPPTRVPTIKPTNAPTERPTMSSLSPSIDHSDQPSVLRSRAPSGFPSPKPSVRPTPRPSTSAPLKLPPVLKPSRSPSPLPSVSLPIVSEFPSVTHSTSPSSVLGRNNGCAASEMRFQLSVTTDSYPAEDTWELLTLSKTLVLSGGPYDLPNTAYTEDICIPNGPYVFVMTDKYGDGMCCENGQGSYSVTINGEDVWSGGEFKKTEETKIMPQCGADEAHAMVEIKTDYFGSETSWTLENQAGEILMSGSGYGVWDSAKDATCIDVSSCYTFTIRDQWGDGMCCSYGYGGYSIDFAGQTYSGSFTDGFEESVRIGSSCPALAASASNAEGGRRHRKKDQNLEMKREAAFAKAQHREEEHAEEKEANSTQPEIESSVVMEKDFHHAEAFQIVSRQRSQGEA